MKENRFEELWQKAEAQGYGRRLAAEFPDWQNRRRNTRLAAAAIVAVVAIATLLTTLLRPSPDYDKVYCNRAGTPQEQWVALASEMLME